MPDSGSQSPITINLNYLARKRLASASVQGWIERLLTDPNLTVADIANSQPIDGTIIALKRHEKRHITNWLNQRPDHLNTLRAFILTAVKQNQLITYDWEEHDELEIYYTINKATNSHGITFKSPRDF